MNMAKTFINCFRIRILCIVVLVFMMPYNGGYCAMDAVLLSDITGNYVETYNVNIDQSDRVFDGIGAISGGGVSVIRTIY